MSENLHKKSEGDSSGSLECSKIRHLSPERELITADYDFLCDGEIWGVTSPADGLS